MKGPEELEEENKNQKLKLFLVRKIVKILLKSQLKKKKARR